MPTSWAFSGTALGCRSSLAQPVPRTSAAPTMAGATNWLRRNILTSFDDLVSTPAQPVRAGTERLIAIAVLEPARSLESGAGIAKRPRRHTPLIARDLLAGRDGALGSTSAAGGDRPAHRRRRFR